MRVFWAWQSDTPGRIGRFFVRDALQGAIDDLKKEIEVEEPERDELHLDHDRKGVPGSPDLANVILKKIRECAVFVADVTPVGRREGGKSLMNPNVAIELGYALAHVGDERMLMVMNEEFGGRGTLPFDLRHKAGPLMFNLQTDATTQQIQGAMRSFKGELKVALRECLRAYEARAPQAVAEARTEIQSKTTPAQYFDEGEVLVDRETPGLGNVPLRYKSGRLLYLRVIPTIAIDQLREVDLAELVFGIKVSPLHFYLGGGACHGRNQYGGLTYSFEAEGQSAWLVTSTQLFANREIWGIDAYLLERGGKVIYAKNIEQILHSGLHHYVAFGKDHLAYGPPLIVEAGAAGVRDVQMREGEFGRVRGTVTHPEIKSRQRLDQLDIQSIDSVLLTIFEDFFDAAGLRRLANYGGFPKTGDGSGPM